MKEIILLKDFGQAKKGSIFIQGLHGRPYHECHKNTKPNDWYWEKNRSKNENCFIHKNCIEQALKDKQCRIN